MSATTSNHSERLLRRAEAAKYVVETYNVPCSPKTLAKIACISSEGPPFRLAGRFPLYPTSGLDAWAHDEDRPPDPVDVRSPHRRLIPENENPAARFPWRDQRAHRALQKAYIMHTDSKTDGQIQGLPLFDWRAVVVHKPDNARRPISLSPAPHSSRSR